MNVSSHSTNILTVIKNQQSITVIVYFMNFHRFGLILVLIKTQHYVEINRSVPQSLFWIKNICKT